jgi:hypothetical protein
MTLSDVVLLVAIANGSVALISRILRLYDHLRNRQKSDDATTR